MTDERILQKMQAGQTEALHTLMEKYNRYVYNIIAYILGHAGSREDVEELLQDTFYSVWQHAENIQSRKLKAYLCAAARNKAKSWLRSHMFTPEPRTFSMNCASDFASRLLSGADPLKFLESV